MSDTVLKPTFYSGQNIYRDNLQRIVSYDSSKRTALILSMFNNGVVNPTPYDLSAMRVVVDSYRNNSCYLDFQSSSQANNPITMSASGDPRILYAQKFYARSNNIQKVRLWMLVDVPPGTQFGEIFVEIRALVGSDCTSSNSCNCNSTLPTGASPLITEPASQVLARRVLDHNTINNSFPYIDVSFATEPLVSNLDDRSLMIPGQYYAIVIGRNYSTTGTLQIHGNFGNNLANLESYVTKFDPTTGLWTNYEGDSIAYQIFSNTVELLPGDGIVSGASINNPTYVEDSVGNTVRYHLGNLDLAHVKNIVSAGAVDQNGDGRNMVIARIREVEMEYQPNPRTGNPNATATAEVIEASITTERLWSEMSSTDQAAWLILAYVTDENTKTIKGLYEPPCDINAAAIAGNWSPGLINIEDARVFVPHAQALKYSLLDEPPARAISTSYNTNLIIPQADSTLALASVYINTESGAPSSVFKTGCVERNQLSVFDSAFGMTLTTPHMGKYLYYADDAGTLKKLNIIPPMVQSSIASADITSVPRTLNASTTIGACVNANMGLRVRLQWTPPSDPTSYRGLVIVRSTEDYPRSIDDGVIIAVSEKTFTTLDGRVYNFDPVGQANPCCNADNPEAGIIGKRRGLNSPLPELSMELVSAMSGTLNSLNDIVEYSIIPGTEFNINVSAFNLSSAILHPRFDVDIIYAGGSINLLRDYQAVNASTMYVSSSAINDIILPVTIPTTINNSSFPTGYTYLMIRVYDGFVSTHPQIGTLTLILKNETGESFNSGLTAIAAPLYENDQAVEDYIADSTTLLSVSAMSFLNISAIPFGRLSLKSQWMANYYNGTTNQIVPTDSINLTPLETVNGSEITMETLLDYVGANASVVPVSISSDTFRLQFIDIVGSSIAIGNSTTAAPSELFLSVVDETSEADIKPIVAYYNQDLYLVPRQQLVLNQECSCYVDAYSGTAYSAGFVGCERGYNAAACNNGMSYNLIYYYTVFTYNDAGHFSYVDSCARAEYGIGNALPPGPVCQLAIVPQASGNHGPLYDSISLSWVNPDESSLYGVRIYVSKYRYATNFVEPFDASDPMYILYDSVFTPNLNAIVNVGPGTSSAIIDGVDNFIADPDHPEPDPYYGHTQGYRGLYKLSSGGDAVFTESSTSSAVQFENGVIYHYTVFTYDVNGNYNTPTCVDRGQVSYAL